jgi:curved DNA-binding protein CbpA
MKFQYFKTDLTTNLTIEEAKRQYKRLILTHHPDLAAKNGMTVEEATKATQTINAEWDYLKAHNYNIHETKDGGVYTDWNQDVADDVTAKYADIIEALIHMEGVVIELCGSFIWLSGNTYEHKSDIKGLGFRWANKKKMWFLAPSDWKKKGHKELSMSDIRNTYGSQVIGVGKTAAGRALTA